MPQMTIKWLIIMKSEQYLYRYVNIICCALCPGVVDWHNYGTVLGALESGLGISLDKYLHFVTFYVGMGPL